MALKLLFLYLVGLVSVLMALAVLIRNQKSSANRSFFAMVFFVGLWGAGIATFLLVHDSTLALIAAKTYYFAAMATAVFVAMFSVTFPVPKKHYKIFVYSSVAFLTVLGLSLVKKTFLTERLAYHDWGKEIILNGKIYGIYAVILISLFIFCFINLIISAASHKTEKLLKRQVWLLFGGLLIASIFGVYFNLILPWMRNYKLIWAGPMAVSLFLIGASYNILKLKLFNVRTVVARSMAYLFTLLVIVVAYLLFSFSLASIIFKTSLTTQQIIYFAATGVVTALVFQPVKKYFDKVSNRLFYRDAYNAQELMNSINSSIVSITDLYKLLETTSKVVKDNLKASFANFYIDNKAVIDFHIVGTEKTMFADEKWKQLLDCFNAAKNKVFSEGSEQDENIAELMHDLKIDIALRMISQDQNVGYLIIGQKQSGNSFTDQDIQVLEIIADEVAIAVQNTLRYEEIALFNVTLQKKINNATAELQRTNEKLKALDEAKDEFISMASHQLRTPLTSVKGYISMLIDGDAGELKDQQRRFLEQAYNSSQRMVYLIADLLNVSRLKTGKFIIEPGPTYLPEVIASEIAQLDETAKARGLEIIYDKPKEFPVLNIDETKIRQVIMNFADNAIYYTPKGGKITIELKQTKDSVEMTVTDTGIGVPKVDQHKLFTKFYRAGNARKARPDGTGLGIFMAKKVVAAQGGAIIFKTAEGKGSTFGFTFPRAKLEVSPSQK
jgi:signal transduction histidine kinase